jgi:uncharacterized membrane protein
MSLSAEHYSGPLPPPQMLEQYNRAVANGAERIMAMAEKQQDHRHILETKVINGRIRAELLGTVSALVLAVLVLGVSVYLVKLGQSAAGIAALVADLTALAAVFVYGRYSQKKENERKLQALTAKPKR